MLPERLQAARLSLAARRPYLASALWALVPVERPGLGTLAVDAWWRLYYDPAFCAAVPVEQLAGVLYHEICHLLRSHHERAEAMAAEAVLWNIASDAEINDDLIKEDVPLPGQPVTPAGLGQPDGLLAEEYYAALQARQPAPGQGAPAQPAQGGAGDHPRQGDDPALGEGAQSAAAEPGSRTPGAGGGAPEASPTAEGTGHAGSAQARGRGGAPPSQQGGARGAPAGDAGSSTPPASSASPHAPSGHGGVPSQASATPVPHGSGSGTDAMPSAARARTPAPGAGRCGSCAHGHPEPWEEPPPGEGGPPGVSRAEAQLIRRQVAEEIVRIASSSASRGSIPGHWRRWAEKVLRPRVDWRRELASLIRRAVADVAGAADYSYRRPSRRQGAVSNVILPSLRQPVPEVAVVIDTSASISDRQLAQALAEVAGVLRACGLRQGVTVLAVDAQVQACRRVFRPEQVRLAGGGGTDMGVGIEAALHLRPKPQVVIVLTDGYTPWPDQPPQGVRVVVGLLGNGSAPPWARTVTITDGR